MKVLITGATGLVGREIVKLCHQQGYSVNYLTRNKKTLANDKNYKGYHWDIEKGEIDQACFTDVHAIIHLAGASIAKRWTESYKQTIIDSRVNSAQLIYEALTEIPHQVEHFISASAIGVYPSSLLNYYHEDFDTINPSFLGDVVSLWEQSANKFTELDISVAKIRIGVVLDKNDGALPKIAQPVKLGVGAPLGSGKQWQSWIHVKDLAGIFMHVLDKELVGVYNAVSPAPVTNNVLTKTVALALKKPYFMPKIPKAILKIMLGDMSAIVLESQRVCSKKIEDSGYNFEYHNLAEALKDIYN